MLPGTAPPRFRQPLLPAAAARSSASEQQQQQQQRCRAGRAEQSIIVSARRRGHSVSTSLAPPLSTAPLSAAARPLPSRPAVAASASRRSAAASAAAAAVKAAPPSLFDPAAVSDAIKAFFSSAPSPLPQVPSLAAALAAAAALPPARRDALAALATAVGAYALVKFFDKVATRGWLDQVHFLFLFFFHLFSLFLCSPLAHAQALSETSPPRQTTQPHPRNSRASSSTPWRVPCSSPPGPSFRIPRPPASSPPPSRCSTVCGSSSPAPGSPPPRGPCAP